MLEMAQNGVFTLEQVVDKMCHAPAICFQLAERGFLREGYFADLVLVNLNDPWTVGPENVYHKCGWTPFEGQSFLAQVHTTLVNGQIVYQQGQFDDAVRGQRVTFAR